MGPFTLGHGPPRHGPFGLLPLCFMKKKVLPIYGSRDKDFPRVGGIGDIDRAQLGSNIIYGEVMS